MFTIHTKKTKKKSSKRHKIKLEWKNTSFSEIGRFNVKKMPASSQLI